MPANIVIPPPSEADMATDLAKAYRCSGLLPDPGGDVVASFIRRCHAVESENDALRAENAKLRGRVEELEEALRKIDNLRHMKEQRDDGFFSIGVPDHMITQDADGSKWVPLHPQCKVGLRHAANIAAALLNPSEARS